MPENPKDKKDGTWEEDQKEREYYYDDSHGYKDYDSENDDESDEEGEDNVEVDVESRSHSQVREGSLPP